MLCFSGMGCDLFRVCAIQPHICNVFMFVIYCMQSFGKVEVKDLDQKIVLFWNIISISKNDLKVTEISN